MAVSNGKTSGEICFFFFSECDASPDRSFDARATCFFDHLKASFENPCGRASDKRRFHSTTYKRRFCKKRRYSTDFKCCLGASAVVDRMSVFVCFLCTIFKRRLFKNDAYYLSGRVFVPSVIGQ